MPVPEPRKNEEKEEFMERCVSFLIDEGTDNEQAVAICATQWRNKMSDKSMIKYFATEIKETNDKERTFTMIGSKEVVDADGDIVKVDGIDLKRFKKNPVILPYHNYNGFPIGKGVGKKVWVEDKKLMFKFQLATAEESPLADQAYRLIKGGYLKTSSIGFIPNWNEIEYPEKDKKGARRIFNKTELLELSLVAVPSNPEALLAGINKAWDDGVLDGEELNTWEELLKTKTASQENPDDPGTTQIEGMTTTADPRIIEYITINSARSMTTDPGIIEKAKELVSKIIEKDIKIAELELMLKEQKNDEEIENDFESYLIEVFDEFDQDNGSKTEEDNEDWISEALEELTEDAKIN